MLQQIFGEYLVGVLKLKSMVFKIANFVFFFFLNNIMILTSL